MLTLNSGNYENYGNSLKPKLLLVVPILLFIFNYFSMSQNVEIPVAQAQEEVGLNFLQDTQDNNYSYYLLDIKCYSYSYEYKDYDIKNYKYIYDGNNNLMFFAEYYIVKNNTNFIDSLQRYYQYDKNDSLLESISKKKYYDETWDYFDKNENKYNDNGLVVEKLNKKWDFHKKQWNDNKRINYKYYDNGKIKYELFSDYDVNSQTWHLKNKFYYQYNEKGKITQLMTSNFFGNHWYDRTKTSYIYDNNDRLITIRTQNTNYDIWKNYSRTTYSYNQQDLPVTEVIERFDGIRDTWFLYQKSIYMYDNNNLLDTILLKQYDESDEDNPKWVDAAKSVYSRDSNGILDSLESFAWKDNKWKPQTLKHVFADTNGTVYNDIYGSRLIFNRISFTLTPVTLVSPPDNASDQETYIKFVWNKSPDAENYILQIATDKDFNNIIQEHNYLKDTSYTFSGFENNTQYFWRVRVVNKYFAGEFSDVWTFNTKTVSSVDTYSNKNDTFISPNPATDYIDVMLNEAKEPVLSVKVYDILGVCVLTHPLAPSREGESVRIDVSGFAKGVYFVRVGGKMYKFVKI